MDEDGSSWALDADGYLVRLDDRLRVLGRSWTATSGARLVGLGERRVALLDVAQGRLLVYASGGSLEWTREESYLVGLGTGVGWREGVLVTTPGALVVFDARGRSLPGQGGFVFLASAGHTSS